MSEIDTLGSKHLLHGPSQLSASVTAMTGSNIIITQIIVFILKINNNREEKRQKLL